MQSTVMFLVKQAAALILVSALGLLYFRAGKCSCKAAAEIDEYRFKFRALAPLGLYVAGKIPWSFDSRSRRVRSVVADLYGHRRVDQFFIIHMAQKAVLVTVILFTLAIIALTSDVDSSFYFFCPVITILIYYWPDSEVRSRLKQRKREILIDLPGFINTLALLMNAGLTFPAAVNKIVADGRHRLSRPLYSELNYLLADINAGKPANRAYEDMAARCKVPEVTRFVSTVLLNLNRGNSDLVYVLRNLAQEAWERRKDIARKQGEEASSKLVFPMVMIFAAIAVIVMAPAIMSM